MTVVTHTHKSGLPNVLAVPWHEARVCERKRSQERLMPNEDVDRDAYEIGERWDRVQAR